ncbi:MAG: RICIN domain-containing protein [Actinomycetota bacterium]|nr:RICIN domain-containing protein [Actinomycetota bacterium]
MALFTSEVTIKSLSSGKVLQPAQASEGTKVGQCSRKNSDDVTQRWRLIPVVGVRHQYRIQSVATGMVLEVTGGSCEDKARVCLSRDNGGAHQLWRLAPVGEGKHEYAIMNVHSGKALDLQDGTRRDDAEITQIGYWNGMQQRWVLTACDAGPVSRAVMTIVRNESVFLPIWLRYYRQFFSAQDMYVLDHQSTDGSTKGHGFVRVPVSHPEFGVGWQLDVVQSYQHELVGRYDVVLYTEVDEIVAPDPRLDDLGTYIDRFDEDFVTCQGYEVLHQKDHEPPFDPTRPVLGQRFMWYANPVYSKSLLASVPMLWNGGFHERHDGQTNNDPHLYLIHLHRMDYDICLARHLDRVRFPLAQMDRDRSWGYQNRIVDPAWFSSWFFHDSGSSMPIHPEFIPQWWRDLV